MTAKQRAARAKFKAVVAEAKKLRKKNPKLTQAQAVKQAWAISYSKERKGEKIGATKKSKYKLGDKVYSYQNPYKSAEIILKRFVPWESTSKPNIKDKYVYKLKLDDGFSNYINEDSLSKKRIGAVGATKKKAATKVKAKKRRSTEMHTDTKSHNVNIRVVSGIGEISDMIIHTLKLYDNKRQYHEKQYKFWINNAKQYPKDKKQSLKYARENKNLITYYTKQIAKLRLKIK